MKWVSRVYVSFRSKPLEKELTSLPTDYPLQLCLEAGRGFHIMLRLTTMKYLFVSRILQLGGWILRRSFQRGSKLGGCLRIEKSVTGWHSFGDKATGHRLSYWSTIPTLGVMLHQEESLWCLILTVNMMGFGLTMKIKLQTCLWGSA